MEAERNTGAGEPKLRVLMLEDVAVDAELCERELKRGGVHFIAKVVDTRPAFEHELHHFGPDLVISDFSLPSAFDGLSALEIARQWRPDIPFVFVSGTIGEERAVEAMKRGATDYVLKDRLNRLVPVIKRALQESADRVARQHAEDELGEVRLRLDAILSSLLDVVWSCSAGEKRLVYINPAAAHVFGRQPEHFLDNAGLIVEITHPEDRDRVAQARAMALDGQSYDLEYRVVWPDSSVHWIHDRGTPVRDDAGRVTRVDGLARDVTRRVLAQERIARLTRMHAVLSGINGVIVRVRDRQELFRASCRVAVQHGGFRLVWTGEIDPDTQDIRPVCWDGHNDGFVEGLKLSARAEAGGGNGPVGLAVRSGEPVIVNDIYSDSRIAHAQAALAHGLRSLAVVPLVVNETVTGVLTFYAAEPDFFDAAELGLLRDMGANLAFALDSINKAALIDHFAYYDTLTGLPNRKLFYDRVGQLITHAAAGFHRVAIAVLDVERFRTINETLGVAAGDAFLKGLASRLQASIGEAGTLARLGADRFALAFRQDPGDVEVVRLLQDRVIAVMELPVVIEGQELRMPAKIGIAMYRSDGLTAEVLMLNAEAALAQAKHSGERILFYARPMNARVAEKLKLENDLRTALTERQFILYYQPRIDLASGKMCGLEALIRWRHPVRGMVMPGDFIPVLEETGMILEVGGWAFAQAAKDAARWRARGHSVPSIGVNVSAIQLRQKDFVREMREAIQSGDAGVNCIEIELTESMVMDNVAGSSLRLAEVREAGIQIAIDDFGTGYSSLSYLARLPVDTLKIDQSFIREMTASPEHLAIVTAIISLARTLNMKVVAEGVETEEQAAALRALNCNEVQGYLYSRPQPPEEIEKLLASGAPVHR
jgi:diguanylate cyclase (GGDEF)-like protein/PAS domain S-box-containing protein